MRRALTIAALCLVPAVALAHRTATGWEYGAHCCNPVTQNGNATTGDCAEIPSSAVLITPTGYEVTLKPGDHPLVTKPHRYVVAMRAGKQSGDEHFHACLWPTEATMRCLFVPPMGM